MKGTVPPSCRIERTAATGASGRPTSCAIRRIRAVSMRDILTDDATRINSSLYLPGDPLLLGGTGAVFLRLFAPWTMASAPHTPEAGNRRCTPINADGSIRVRL